MFALYFVIIILAVLLWFILAFIFPLVGKMIVRYMKYFVNILNKNIEDKKEREDF